MFLTLQIFLLFPVVSLSSYKTLGILFENVCSFWRIKFRKIYFLLNWKTVSILQRSSDYSSFFRWSYRSHQYKEFRVFEMAVTLSEECCVWMSESVLLVVPTVFSTVKFLYFRGEQILGPRSSRLRNSVQWHLIFVGLQHGTSIVSSFWLLEFWA